jgi:hypothetical protein
MTYAAKIVNNVSTEVIVGTAAWATEHLGGFWVDSETKVGIGWLWDGHHLYPPSPPPDPEEVTP